MMVAEHIELEQRVCPVCGVAYAGPVRFFANRRELPKDSDNRHWFCINGHRLSFTTSEADDLRRERDLLKQREAMLTQEAEDAREEARKAAAALKRHKRRSAAGTCPCCKRTFSNMNTHMRKQHPSYVAEHGAQVVPIAARKRP